MSKIFKCFVCGLLGIVIGAGATFGAMAAAVYYSYGNVTVSSVIGDNEYNDVLGDLKDFSVDEILGLIQKGQANPENYTFRDLELKYGFDMVALINKFGGGNDKIIADDGSNAKYVEQLKDVSPFTILKGGDGAKKFLDNLPFGAVLSFIPSSTMFAENERVILRRYSVGDMFKKDPITGETGIAGALREVRVGGVFPVLFDYDETSDTYKVKDGKYSGLSLVGNLKFGPFIDLATGKKDASSVFGEGGFFTDKTLGEYLESLGVTDEKITERIDAALSGLTISGLFNKNYETGKYEFVLENLLGSLNVGGALGYVYEDGVWYKNKDKTETVEGLMAVIASFDLTKIYRALKSDVGVWEKIRKVALSLGDASFGDILKTLGYKYNGEKWLNKDGKEPKAGILVAMSDVRVSDLLGGKDELDATKLRVKIAKEIMLHCGDMTLGDGFGGLLKVTYDEEKKAYVWSEGSNAGKEINGALNELLLTDINDIAQIFAQEKIDGKQIERVLLTLTDGIKVGYVLGSNRADDGTWTSGQGKAIESKYYKFYEVTLDKLIAPFFDGAEASDIFDIFIDALGEETTLGEVVAPFFGCEVGANKEITYIGSKLERYAFAADKIFKIALKELKNKEDRFASVRSAMDGILLGDIAGYRSDKDGTWYDVTGDIKEVDVLLGKLYETSVKEFIGDDIDFATLFDGVTVGEAMKKHKVGDTWYDENNEEEADAIMLALYDCSLSDLLNGNLNIKDTIKNVTLGAAAGVEKNADGSWKTDDVVMKKLYDEKLGDVLDGNFNLGNALGGVVMGEVLGYKNDNGVWKDGDTPITDPITKKICNLDIGEVLAGNVKFDTLFDNVKLGEMMGCTYCDSATCNTEHEHGWYDKNGKVTGITAVMVGLTVSEVKNGTFTQKLNDLTLQDVVGDIKSDDPLSLIGGNTKLSEISDKMKDISNATLGKFKQVGIITAKEEQLDSAFEKILKLVANDIAKGNASSPLYEEGHVYQFSEDIRTEAAAYIKQDAATGDFTYDSHGYWSNMTFTRMMECMIAASNSLNV